MSASFIHVSDIHFGQEKGGRVYTHKDVRECLIDDARRLVRTLPNGRIDGVIVSGDVAFAGEKKQYTDAGLWLDRLAEAGGCKITDIQVVPGNHDIIREGISRVSDMMLAEIKENGEDMLDFFLELEKDREVLYGRFDAYRDFAEAYDCPLDRDGGRASERIFEIAPGRALRFIGLNSALCCAKRDEKGKLLLGARQRVLPRKSGEELIVICHHPLPWLRDSDEARKYVRSRARVFISGHEHTPRIDVDPVENGCDLLMIAAGATVPPVEDADFTFTYNLLEFDWDKTNDGLVVTVQPRVWSPSHTAFEANTAKFGRERIQNVLGCPNFRTAAPIQDQVLDVAERIPRTCKATTSDVSPGMSDAGSQEERKSMEDKFPFLLLRFFRDLTDAQRLAVLVETGALPKNWNGALTHPLERRAIDFLKSNGKLDVLEKEIHKILGEPVPGEKD